MTFSKEFINTYRLTDLFDNCSKYTEFEEEFFYILNMLKEEFISKRIDYFFKTGTKEPQEKLSFSITPKSVMHLFGISYYDINCRNTPELYNNPSFALEFYRDFNSGKLELNKCWVESLEKVLKKMEVLREISRIKTFDVRIGQCGQLRTICMTNTIRVSKSCLGLGLCRSNQGFSIPKTCLNLQADVEANNNVSFKRCCKCSKIIEYLKLQNGKWKKINRITTNLKNSFHKRKHKKKRRKN